MPPLLLVSSTSLLLAAAIPAHAGGPPVCNAKHKRPANLYGSVLSEGLKPAVTDSPLAAVPLERPAANAPLPQGAQTPSQALTAQVKASFAPCSNGVRP